MNPKHFFKAALLCTGLLTGSSAFAQDEVGGLIKSTPEDAMKLANAYLTPLFRGFGIGLNSGWNNTGRAKNTGRFELRVGFTGAFVPRADESFDVTSLGLSNNVRPTNPSRTISPTVASSSPDRVEMGIYNNAYLGGTVPVETFDLPDGANIPFIPAPQLQATVGLPKGIDVTLRAMPDVNLGDFGKIGMIGGGVKVDVLPLFSKTADKVIPVDLGLAVGYTQFTFKLPLEVDPPSGAPRDPDQRIDAKFSGANVEAILSKKLMFFTPFVSVGYNTAKTDARLKGDYEFITGVSPTGEPSYYTSTDPITLKNSDIGGMRANAGFQLNLAVLRFYASYSVAEYNSFNAGIGIGIGK